MDGMKKEAENFNVISQPDCNKLAADYGQDLKLAVGESGIPLLGEISQGFYIYRI